MCVYVTDTRGGADLAQAPRRRNRDQGRASLSTGGDGDDDVARVRHALVRHAQMPVGLCAAGEWLLYALYANALYVNALYVPQVNGS